MTGNGSVFICAVILWLALIAGVVSAGDVKLSAVVAPYKGRNVFVVNDQPMAPQMYSGTEGSRDTWAGQPRRSLEEFAALGYRIIQTDLWFKYSLRPDGTFDMAGIRRQLGGILQVDSSAMIVVRINISAPGWWLKQNTNEICRTTGMLGEKNTFGGNHAESLASEKYAEFARQNLKRFLAELEKTPEGDRVIGFHLGGGVYGEWHYYGIYAEPDASEPMRRAFRSFAKDKYGPLTKVNEAWHTAFKSFDDIVVPSYDRRYEVTDGDFRDPQLDRYVIDYYQCQQKTVAGLVEGLAKLIKETWPRSTLVGLFYGYFFGNWTVGAQASQFDIKSLFRSPYVDYFAGPYGFRSLHESGYFRTMVDSVTLNGKVWMSEHDGGTHLGNSMHATFPNVAQNEGQSVAQMRRNFMYTLTEGAGQWWYDFGPKGKSGWWSSPVLLSEAGKLRTLASELMEHPYQKPADVLIVNDMDAFNYVRPARVDQLTFKITQEMMETLLGTGAAYDRIFLMDLRHVDLSRYKLIIFGNTFILGAAERDHIRKSVIAPGRTVVFMSGAGYSDGVTNDVSLISGLVGMRVAKVDGPPPVAEGKLNGRPFTIQADGVRSLFKITDPAAQVIGTYLSGETAVASKDVNGGKVYYFGLPLKTTSELLGAIMQEAGVRIYMDGLVARDYVSVGGGLIGIYSVDGGEKRVKSRTGGVRAVTLPPFTAKYFDLGDGHDMMDGGTR